MLHFLALVAFVVLGVLSIFCISENLTKLLFEHPNDDNRLVVFAVVATIAVGGSAQVFHAFFSTRVQNQNVQCKCGNIQTDKRQTPFHAEKDAVCTEISAMCAHPSRKSDLKTLQRPGKQNEWHNPPQTYPTCLEEAPRTTKCISGVCSPEIAPPPVVSSVRNSSLQLTWVSHYETTWNGVFPEISGEKSRTLRVWRVSGGRQGTDEHAIHRSRSSVVCGFVCCLRRCLMFQVLKYFRTQKRKPAHPRGLWEQGDRYAPPPDIVHTKFASFLVQQKLFTDPIFRTQELPTETMVAPLCFHVNSTPCWRQSVFLFQRPDLSMTLQVPLSEVLNSTSVISRCSVGTILFAKNNEKEWRFICQAEDVVSFSSNFM